MYNDEYLLNANPLNEYLNFCDGICFSSKETDINLIHD